jgi:hypothetical protein
LGLTVDDVSGLVLTVDGLSGEDAATLEEWMGPIAEAPAEKARTTSTPIPGSWTRRTATTT